MPRLDLSLFHARGLKSNKLKDTIKWRIIPLLISVFKGKTVSGVHDEIVRKV